jgi:hypothetical protein
MVQSVKNIFQEILELSISILLLICLNSCAPVSYLKTETVRASEVTGTYTVILYGAQYSDDLEDVAILEKEGDGYPFEVYAPEFDYKIKRNVPAKEALEAAEQFVRFHHAFWKSRLSKITDPAGNTIGYEVRPLYAPLYSGYPDILDVSYILKDNKVIVRVSFKEELKRGLFDEEAPVFRFRK